MSTPDSGSATPSVSDRASRRAMSEAGNETPLVDPRRGSETPGSERSGGTNQASHRDVSRARATPEPKEKDSAEKKKEKPVRKFNIMGIMKSEAPFAETFCCTYDFTTPELELPMSVDPKMLNVQGVQGMKRKFIDYRPCTLDAEPTGVVLNADLKMPLDLMEFDGVPSSRVLKDITQEDQVLLNDGISNKRRRVPEAKKIDTSVFLRKATYITNDLYTSRDSYVIGHHSAEKRLMRDGNEEGDAKSAAALIAATFEDVKIASRAHPFNKKAKVKRVSPILPSVQHWATRFLQVKFDENPFPQEIDPTYMAAVLGKVAEDAEDVPVNFGAFGFFLRDDDKCDAPGMGASIGSTDEDPATYKMQRPYIWENKGHNQSMEAGTKFEFKDRFFLLDFPEEGAESLKGVQDGPAAVRYMNLSSRMKMVKARSKALPPDLTEVLNEVDRLQVGVRPMKDTEVDKAKDKMRQIVDVDYKAPEIPPAPVDSDDEEEQVKYVPTGGQGGAGANGHAAKEDTEQASGEPGDEDIFGDMDDDEA